jgi:hypothetical protein
MLREELMVRERELGAESTVAKAPVEKAITLPTIAGVNAVAVPVTTVPLTLTVPAAVCGSSSQ